LAGCAAFSMFEAGRVGRPSDGRLAAASALSERGDSYDERKLISELNKKKDWAGLLRFAQASSARTRPPPIGG